MNFDAIQLRARELFRQEATDLIRELEAALLELETDLDHPAAIHRVFRAMHTLKGSGATSGFTDLADFVHHVEDLYNAARESRLALTSPMIDRTLLLVDAIARYLAAPPATARAVLSAAQPDLDALIAFLNPPAPGPIIEATPATTAVAAPSAPGGWRIHFAPAPGFFLTGSDPAVFLDDLRELGPCEINADPSGLPPLHTLAPEQSYLTWDITLRAPVPEAALHDLFLFVADDCTLTFTPLVTEAAAAPTWHCAFQLTAGMLATPGLLETFWADLSQLGAWQVAARPGPPDAPPAPGPWLLHLATEASEDRIRDTFAFMMQANPVLTRVAGGSAPPPPPAVPVPPPPVSAEPPAAPRPTDETLRVSSRKLDHLVNLVGELVILRSQLRAACGQLPALPPALQSVEEALHRITTELRDVVLDVRMMPIGDTFNKFRRLTRDMSRDLGKTVELVIAGADTELDKSVLDQLNDPLVHLVRNCLDHGLEPPAERTAAGKAPGGTLRLSAAQQGDRVRITIADDGRGLDPARIRAKAIDRGLLAPGAALTEAELFQLIFLPGFSTAATVSTVSGRGVGLDVVKRNIEHLRGTVELTSRPGRGTEIRLSLPLTLAIIEGLMVGVDGDRYIMPLSAARETIELTAEQRTSHNGRNLVELRGRRIPYLRLRDLFGQTSAPPPVERVVIVEFEDQPLGLVVDEVVGNHQTVLKSLGWLSHRVRIFSGSTVLGDGRAALIFDLAGLVDFARRRQAGTQGLAV